MSRRLDPYNPQILRKDFPSGRITEAFSQNAPLIDRMSFQNNNMLLHNNVGESVLSEQIFEYRIHADSYNRDLSLYPNQFNFDLSFDSQREPAIGRRIKNVKYVKIDNVRIPNVHKIVEDGDDWIFSTDDTDKFTYDRYVVLKINQINNGKILSSNSAYDNGCFTLYRDNDYGEWSTWVTSNNTIVFPDSNLFNMFKLTLQLIDRDGDTFVMTGMDSSITDPTDLRYYKNIRTQMTVDIIAGVVENYINTETQYST